MTTPHSSSIEPRTDTAAGSALRSPTYPQRVHIRERSHWLSVLASWDQKIAAVSAKKSPEERDSRLFAQIAGARDQIADAARRLPMEVGDMYEEDKHRLEEAVAALERLFARGIADGTFVASA